MNTELKGQGRLVMQKIKKIIINKIRYLYFFRSNQSKNTKTEDEMTKNPLIRKVNRGGKAIGEEIQWMIQKNIPKSKSHYQNPQ